MRLGVVGLMPQDFRTVTQTHLKAIRALNLTGVGFAASADILFNPSVSACQRVKQHFVEADLDLVQLIIGYRECLFDPQDEVRDQLVKIIQRGLEIGRDLEAQVCLIRTGSLNPNGPYSPSRDNLAEANRNRLLETLRRIAGHAEASGQTVVIETHLWLVEICDGLRRRRAWRFIKLLAD